MLNKFGNWVGDILLDALNERPWLVYGPLIIACSLCAIVSQAIPYIIAGCAIGIGECKIP